MTLSTLKTMNFSMGDVANALKIKAADTLAGFTGSPAPATSQFAGLEIPPRTYGTAEPEAPQAAPAPKPSRSRSPKKAAARAAAPAATGGVVDPVQWWGALSQQFQQIASNAMKDVARQTALDTTRQVATGLTDQALKTATGMAGKAARGVGRAAARAVGGRPGDGKVAPKRAPAAKPRAVAAKKVSSTQPLAAGDWTLPNAFFPGLAPAVPQPVTRKTVGKKPAARKAPPRKTSSRR